MTTNVLQIPPKTVKSDGCSGGLSKIWQALFHRPPPFEICCLYHDIEYHYGAGADAGPWENFTDRLYADNQLAICLWRNSWQGKIFALPVWFAVRLFGGAYWHRNRSWGFGWREQKRG